MLILPCGFVLFDSSYGVLHGFVAKCVHRANKKVQGTNQDLAILGQCSLGLCVVKELFLKFRRFMGQLTKTVPKCVL